jgi:trigger factor
LPENFLPKFCEQIVGMNAGDTRSVQVVFPEDFPVQELAGKKADYAMTLNEIKEKVLPPMDDAFAAKLMPDKTLADLRHTVEHNLEHEKEHEIERVKESQIVKFLQEHVSFDLPPSLLQNETRRALNELVHRNRERGIPDEMLKGKEKELIEGAGSLAAHRLKSNFILHRIAEHEKIEVTREELDERIRELAAQYNISVDKMKKELEENDRLNGVAEELLLGKTLDFLKSNVSVETISEPAAATAPTE